MSEEEEQITETNPTVNRVIINDEPPGQPFRFTLELPLFLVMAGISLSRAALNNVVLYRACVHSLGHPKEECNIFISLEKNNQSHLEHEVQQYVTAVSTVGAVLEAAVPAVLSMFLGVWSDTHGRKPLLVWPIFGIAATSMLQVVYCMTDDLDPWWFVATVIPYSVCGGFTILVTGAFCYLSDVTASKQRGLRMTILQASTSVGSVVGSVCSAHVLRLVGYTWLVFIAATLNVTAYAYSSVYLRESLRGAVEGGISTVFDGLLLKETVRECFKRRPNFGRAQILLLVMANSLAILILYGEINLEILYTREKLHWTLSDFTQFSAISTMLAFVGGFVGIVVLQKMFGLSDLVTANVGYVGALTEHVIRAMATRSWHMYLGAGLSMFQGLSAPLVRSFLTKILPVVDIAKVFALMAAIEGLCPLLAPLIFNSLYWYSLATCPGAIYILSSALTVVSVACLTIVQYFRWNVTSQYERLDSTS